MHSEMEHERPVGGTSHPHKNLVILIYALYALNFVTGFTAIIGVIIAHIKKGEAQGSVCDTHFSYQIRTFWWGLVWALVAAITIFIGIGFVLAFAVSIWFIYRIVKGFLRINDGLPV
jgi:uncharacterized membrane protein